MQSNKTVVTRRASRQLWLILVRQRKTAKRWASKNEGQPKPGIFPKAYANSAKYERREKERQIKKQISVTKVDLLEKLKKRIAKLSVVN